MDNFYGLNYKNCHLFMGLDKDLLSKLFSSKYVQLINFNKGEYVFNQLEVPRYLYILVSGAVTVGKNDINGKRTIVNVFRDKGTVFGEIYLYLNTKAYDYSCNCILDSHVLAISKDLLLDDNMSLTNLQSKLSQNMLTILSEKAFHLNQKLLIQSSYSLRQKIAHFLLQQEIVNNIVSLPYNREELAEYIVTTRPSLSRELGNMERDGLINVSKSIIKIKDLDGLKNLL